MAKVTVTQGFLEDLESVESKKVLAAIVCTVELLEVVPDMGSRDLPRSIQEEFGGGARKIPVNPFDLITMYDDDSDEVVVAGLIHQRAAW